MSVDLLLKHAVKPCKVNKKKPHMQVFRPSYTSKKYARPSICQKEMTKCFCLLKKKTLTLPAVKAWKDKHTAHNER